MIAVRAWRPPRICHAAQSHTAAAGLSALGHWPQAKREAYICIGLLLVGGFMLGPLMQKYAFGEWWTGVPFGFDLTDNKTLIAVAFWMFAAWRVRAGSPARAEVILAALVTLVVFAIPHSVWGTEINWDAVPKQ